jgi:predicted metalloprotease
MRWRGRPQSANVEDRRGFGPGGMLVGGGVGSVILVLVVLLMGGDPTQLLQQGSSNVGGRATTAPDDGPREFVAVVLKDTEEVWSELFRARGATYQEPRLVLFDGQVSSACGLASAAVGPFYCPSDSRVYLDTSFFEDLDRRFGAAGDFAQAYVIAHEIGHHVQNQLGLMDRVADLRARLSQQEYNQLSVRLELQADFFAGVWAHHAQRTRQILEEGDIEEALGAASAIGDDRLQMQSQGTVTPDSFTHGSSAQRVAWFRRGYESGDLSQGDTFGAERL